MLIAVTGPIGSGKTLFMTRCLYREKIKNPEVCLATNYKLNNMEFRYITTEDLFSLKSELKDTTLGIDEFHIFLDSRAFMKATNQQLTHFILQTRHLGVNLYFTTQDISQVDIRLRKQLDFLAYCTRTFYEDYFRIKIIDYRDILNVRQNDFIYNGAPYYDLYDTTEIIDIVGDKNNVKQVKSPKEEKIEEPKREINIREIARPAEPKKEKKEQIKYIKRSGYCKIKKYGQEVQN